MQPTIETEPFISLLASPVSIAVATDLTDLERLLPHAIAQAKLTGAHVVLIHARAIPDSVLLGEELTAEQTDAEERARKTLESAAHHVEAQGIRCSVALREGVAVDVVREEMEARQATRLLIGTHGHGYAGQQILGQVANSLLRAVSFPVFVIGPHDLVSSAHTTPRRILHPVSLTGEYRATVAFASQLARTYDAELTLVHVADSGILRGSYMKNIFSDKKRELAELIPRHHSSSKINTVVACGDMVLEVLRLCAATDTDWVVMGIEHDLQWWSRSNNAAYQVIAQAECPVITYRPHPPAGEHPLGRRDASEISPSGGVAH